LPSFTLPDHVDTDTDTLRAVAARHGLDADSIKRLPETGIANAIYRIGDDAILRVPRNHPNFIADARTEVIAVPAARAAGVRTPALLAFDDSLDLLPVPYTIYERVPGVPLESLGLGPDEAAEVWSEVGRQLGRLHAGVAAPEALAGVRRRHVGPDLPALVHARIDEGWLSPLDGRWLSCWLERLEPAAREPAPARFLHGDSQATNLMVLSDPLRFEAVIDWGSAAVGDVALDFAGVPLRAVPHMLAGHRDIAVPDSNDTIEARIVWRHLYLALLFLPRGAVPGRSWAERPLPMLLEVLRFFMDPPNDRWRAVGPVEPARVTSSMRLVGFGGGDHAEADA